MQMKRLFLPLLLLLSSFVYAQSVEYTAGRSPEAVIIGKWNLYYGFNKIKPLKESASLLDSIAQLMTKNPLTVMVFHSYADGMGDTVYNILLSQQRALAFMECLEKRGITRQRIEGKGFGARNIVANELTDKGKDNPAGRALNRRTEIEIYDHKPVHHIIPQCLPPETESK